MAKKRADKPQVELTEGAIRISWRGHVRTISAAAPPPDHEDNADFFILLDDLVCWDPPDDEIEIEMAELQQILEAIDEHFDKLGLEIAYE